MKTRFLIPLGAILLAAAAFAVTAEWKRYYFGDSPLSVEAPSEFKAMEPEKVEEEGWVTETTNYTLESDLTYSQVFVMVAKKDTKFDEAFHTEFFNTFAEGLGGDGVKVKMGTSSDVTIDGQKFKRRLMEVPLKLEGEQTMTLAVNVTVTPFEGKLYGFVSGSFPEVKGSGEESKKIVNSLRFKKGL